MIIQQSNNSTQQPLVSIIMNCFNGGQYLKQAIDSIYAQTYMNWEIVFWDNASTDNSAEIAKKYNKKLCYFRGEETISLGAARNKALKQAKGEFIAFLDCDDLWMPEKLEKQIPLFNDSKVGLVYSDVIHFNSNNDTFYISASSSFYRGMCFARLLKNYFLSLPSVVIRKVALDQETEWFDQRFNLIEEYDLFMRIAYSWKLDMCKEALAKYRVHKSSCSWTKEELFYKEQIILLEKFSKLWPEFSVKYSKLKKMQIYCRRAIYLWKNKKAQEARTCLTPYKYRHSRAFLLYFVSFLSPAAVYKIMGKFRKEVRPEGFLSTFAE